MKSKKKDWLLALALLLPMILFFASYLWHHPSFLIPTGFIQYDNAGYVAYAKQYLDSDKFSFFYSNPFNDSPRYPSIYFQTQSILLALFLKSGITTSIILIAFTLLCSLLCFRIIIAIFDLLAPNSRHRILSLIFFAWGGGLLVLSSIGYQVFQPVPGESIFDNLFLIDPGNGSWGLNLGRALFFSCEAFYHALFLAAILCLLKKKWLPALTLTFLLSASHPFTGTQLVCILLAFVGYEKILVKKTSVPLFFTIGVLCIFFIHFAYYFYYLRQFPDHRSVSEQYSLNWYIRIARMIPAYAITGTLAGYTLFRFRDTFFASQSNRLFLCWFVVSLLLAKHELFMKPMQPIHFTRGYIWTSLFLMGIPALQLFLNTLTQRKSILLLFSTLFLVDNITWVTQYTLAMHKGPSISYITHEEDKLLTVIKNNATENTLIIGESDESAAVLPYLSLVRSKAYAWTSHTFTTPFAAKKKNAYAEFIANGSIDEQWKKRDVLFIFRKQDSLQMKRARSILFPYRELADSKNYLIIAATIP